MPASSGLTALFLSLALGCFPIGLRALRCFFLLPHLALFRAVCWSSYLLAFYGLSGRWARTEWPAVWAPESAPWWPLCLITLCLITLCNSILLLSNFTILHLLPWSAGPMAALLRPHSNILSRSVSIGSLAISRFALVTGPRATREEPSTETTFVGRVAAAFNRNTTWTGNIGCF